MTVSHFEALYSADPDPFGLGDRWYERRKMDVVLASLASEHYRWAWDTACGTGHLAELLAPRTDRLLATDASPAAGRLAQERLADAEHVRVGVHLLPDPPAGGGPFDLVILSEVLYYLDAPARAAAARTVNAVTDASTDAEVLAVCWRDHPSDASVSGEESLRELHSALQATGWSATVRHEDDGFVLRSWRRPGSPS